MPLAMHAAASHTPTATRPRWTPPPIQSVVATLARALALFLVAATVLAWEVFLTRLLSYAVNTLLVYLALGVALTGLGVAGSLTARRESKLVVTDGGPDDALEYGALALQLALPLTTAAFSRLAPELGRWPLATPLAALLLVVPFACGGVVLTLLLGHSARIGRAYAVDLAGSGLGCWLPLVLLRPLGGPGFALLLTALAAGVTLALWWSRDPARRRARRWVPWVAVAVLVVTAITHRPAFHVWPERASHLAMVARHATEQGYSVRRDHSWWNPVGRVEILSFDVPGAERPYPYKFYVQDGTAGALVARWDGAKGGVVPAMCDDALWGQGYLAPRDAVLVIGVGGGVDVQCALHHGAKHVDAVEINPDSIDALRGPLADFTGGIGKSPLVHWHVLDGRAFARAAPARRYDQVQLSGVDTKQVLASGSLALNENRLYTREAFHDYLRVLRPGGVLSVIYFTEVATLRLLNTIAEALEADGAPEPWRHLMVVKNGNVYGILATREPASEETIERFRARWSGESFQGIRPVFIEPFGYEPHERPIPILDPWRSGDPVFGDFSRALASRTRASFADAYPLAIAPVTDDRPFFFDFFKGRSLLAAPHRALLGGLMLWVLVTAAVFIFLPLGGLRRAEGSGPHPLSIAPYFAGLGLGFLLIEVWLIHLFAPLLGHQVLSMAVVLGGLLVATGVGAWLLSERLAQRGAWPVVLGLGAWCGLLELGAPPLTDASIGAPAAVRAALVLVSIAPAGLLMGTLLPAGLAALARPSLRAWALAINFFFSVLGTVAAVPLAMAFGYRSLVPLGLLLYGVTAVTARVLRTPVRAPAPAASPP